MDNKENWACVLFADNVRKTVHIKNIRKFDMKCFDKTKKYHIQREPNVYEKGLVLFFGKSKGHVEEHLLKKRIHIPNKLYVQSPSELSDNEDSKSKRQRFSQKDVELKKQILIENSFERKRKSIENSKRITNETKQEYTSTTKVSKNKRDTLESCEKSTCSSSQDTSICTSSSPSISQKPQNEKEKLKSNEEPTFSSPQYSQMITSPSTCQKSQSKSSYSSTNSHTKYKTILPNDYDTDDDSSSSFLSEAIISGSENNLHEDLSGEIILPSSIDSDEDDLKLLQWRKKHKNCIAKDKFDEKIKEINTLRTCIKKKNAIIESQRNAILNFSQKHTTVQHLEEKIDSIEDYVKKSGVQTSSPDDIHKIGFRDVEEDKTLIGQNYWIPTKVFNTIMNNNKPSIFVKEMARYLFTSEVLIASTVTGRASNRTIKKNSTSKPTQLDPNLLSILRDAFTYYLNSERFATKFKQLEKDKQLGLMSFHISQLICDLKKEHKKKSNNVEDDDNDISD